jgi:hypothetical protein
LGLLPGKTARITDHRQYDGREHGPPSNIYLIGLAISLLNSRTVVLPLYDLMAVAAGRPIPPLAAILLEIVSQVGRQGDPGRRAQDLIIRAIRSFCHL